MQSETDMDPRALRYGRYLLTIERAGAKVRSLPNYLDLYNKASAEWTANGPREPPFGDKIRRDIFYEEVDKLCFQEWSTPEQCIVAAHAAGAAVLVMQEQEFSLLKQCDWLRLARAGNDYATEHMGSDMGLANLVQDATVMPGFTLNFEEQSSGEDEALESLLDQTIRYRQADGTIAECTIVDFGTSHRFASGKYYLVVRGDEEEVMLTENDMKSIIESRVD